MPDPEARALFVDESGDATRNLVLSAIDMPLATVEAARASTAERVAALRALLPGFVDQELHAQKLARPLTPSEEASLAGRPPFRTHERHFVYQHALHHLSELPGVRVYSLMWRWKGKFAPKGRSGGRRYRDLLGELLAWAAEEPVPLAQVTIDRGGQEPWYRKAIETAQEESSDVWAVEMPDSKDDQLVQLADLTAFAAYQSAIPGKAGSHPWMADWYRTALEPNFAEGGDGFGLRHFDGEVTPVAM